MEGLMLAQEVNSPGHQLPSEEKLALIGPNCNVKVCTPHERFWVFITERDSEKLTGFINNDLAHTDKHQLQKEDVISFYLKHVYDVYKL